METIICYTAGGARGNPGPAAIGVYITDSAGEMLQEIKQTIGNSTSAFAEYQAVLIGLETLKTMYDDATETIQFEIRLDSELVKKQLNAEYQIKEPGLVPLFIAIHNLRVSAFPHIILTHITQEQNQDAARLVTEALDGK